MKRWIDLTEKEILNLSDDQVDRYVDYECAINGHPLLPVMPSMPNKSSAIPDITGFAVGGIFFKEAEHAHQMLNLLETLESYSIEYLPGGDYRCKGLKLNTDYSVSTDKFFSPEHWEECRNQQRALIEAEKEYGEAKKDYDDAINERSNTYSWIWDRVYEVRAAERDRQRVRDEFGRYLELAEGDRGIAMNFLKARRTVDSDLESELMGLVSP